MIQALCRWQTEESINVYTCIGAAQYTAILRKAMAVRIDGARAATLAEAAPFIDIADVQRARHHNSPTLLDQVANVDQPLDPEHDADDD